MTYAFHEQKEVNGPFRPRRLFQGEETGWPAWMDEHFKNSDIEMFVLPGVRCEVYAFFPSKLVPNIVPLVYVRGSVPHSTSPSSALQQGNMVHYFNQRMNVVKRWPERQRKAWSETVRMPKGLPCELDSFVFVSFVY